MANTKAGTRYNQAQMNDMCKQGEQFARDIGLEPVGVTYFEEDHETFGGPAIELRLKNGTYGNAWLAILKYVGSQSQKTGGIKNSLVDPVHCESFTLFTMRHGRGIMLYNDAGHIGVSLIQK